jgi:hypothetical protein
MARRPVPPPKPKSPTLTVGQTRRRIERLQKCTAKLEAFDPQRARKRAPAILELEAAIDKALSSAFGYGTPAYLRYNEAATLDPSPLLAEAAARANGGQSGGPPARQDAKVHETREHFAENRARAMALVREAIAALEEQIAKVEPNADKSHSTKPLPEPVATPVSEHTSPVKARPRGLAGIAMERVRHHVGRWMKRKG